MAKTIVVALGGNAILQPGQAGTAAEQLANVDRACHQIAAILAAGDRVVLTHGNGPQVGAILLQQEGHRNAPAMPLDVCGAESQGLIGYFIQNRLGNLLRQAGRTDPVVTLVTQVLVDEADPAFRHPTKPIGPFYTREQALELAQDKGWAVREDAGRGWRRVVPSPTPLAIWEAPAVRSLLGSGAVVICSGGGGIPVHRTADGQLAGVEAVIDKDLAAERLAADVDADLLLILTDVPKVALRYRQPDQVSLDRLSVEEARQYLAAGHFAAGSMGPKVEALVRFAELTGHWGAVASLDDAAAAAQGLAGTLIGPGAPSVSAAAS